MEQRLSIVTLGVAHVAESTAFYERLGWRRSKANSNADISFFQTGSMIFALYGAKALAEDVGVEPGPRDVFSGVTLAHNTRSRADVDAVLAEAEAAGAAIVKPAADAFWGGYSGYFQDPDGHLWEVAWNPFFPIDGDGAITLPEEESA